MYQRLHCVFKVIIHLLDSSSYSTSYIDTDITMPNIKTNKKSKKPGSLLHRNANSPYSIHEVKALSKKNHIITDEKHRSPLGKRDSSCHLKRYRCVEDIEFTSFLKRIGVAK
jgi:hypothetical protein